MVATARMERRGNVAIKALAALSILVNLYLVVEMMRTDLSRAYCEEHALAIERDLDLSLSLMVGRVTRAEVVDAMESAGYVGIAQRIFESEIRLPSATIMLDQDGRITSIAQGWRTEQPIGLE